MTKPPRETDSELPDVTSVGLVKTPKGWVALRLVTEGDRVIDREIVSEGAESQSAALNAARAEFARQFMIAKGGAS